MTDGSPWTRSRLADLVVELNELTKHHLYAAIVLIHGNTPLTHALPATLPDRRQVLDGLVGAGWCPIGYMTLDRRTGYGDVQCQIYPEIPPHDRKEVTLILAERAKAIAQLIMRTDWGVVPVGLGDQETPGGVQ